MATRTPEGPATIRDVEGRFRVLRIEDDGELETVSTVRNARFPLASDPLRGVFMTWDFEPIIIHPLPDVTLRTVNAGPSEPFWAVYNPYHSFAIAPVEAMDRIALGR